MNLCLSSAVYTPRRLPKLWKKQQERDGDVSVDSDLERKLKLKIQRQEADAADDEFTLDSDLMSDILRVSNIKEEAVKQNELYGLLYFKVGPVGTEYTQQHKGVASDSIRGQACDPDSINFCLLFLKQRMVTYGTMQKFSRDDADFLARCWCHQAEHYFRI